MQPIKQCPECRNCCANPTEILRRTKINKFFPHALSYNSYIKMSVSLWLNSSSSFFLLIFNEHSETKKKPPNVRPTIVINKNNRNDGGSFSSIVASSSINKTGVTIKASYYTRLWKTRQRLIYTENNSLIFCNTKRTQSLLTVGFCSVGFCCFRKYSFIISTVISLPSPLPLS